MKIYLIAYVKRIESKISYGIVDVNSKQYEAVNMDDAIEQFWAEHKIGDKILAITEMGEAKDEQEI